MWMLPRIRLVLARRPWIYWSVVAACAAVAWLTISAAHSGATAEQAKWGATRRVWVADAATPAGKPVRASLRRYPAGAVPADAAPAVPAGAIAAQSISMGEVVTRADLAGEATVPPEWVTFAVPARGTPAVIAGRRVAVFGGGQLLCHGMADATEAGGGSSNADAIDIAVPPNCAAALSAQLLAGQVVVARLAATGR